MLQKIFKNSQLLRPLLAILILAIPLYPKFPLYGFEKTYVSIRLEDFLVAFTVLILFIHQIKNRFSLFKHPISKLFIAYFIAISVSTFTAIAIYKTDPTSILLLNVLRRFEYMSLFFITIAAIKSKDDLKHMSIFALIATLGVSVYGYGQKYFQFPVVSTMNSEFSKGQLLTLTTWTRINATFAGHYDLAVYLSVILIIIGAFIILQKHWYQKVFISIIWLIGFQILTFTAARTSMIALWGAGILGLLLIRKYLWIIPLSAIVVFSIFNSKDLNQRLLATIPTIHLSFPSNLRPAPTIIPTPTPTPPPIAIITHPIVPGKIEPTLTPTPTIFHHGTQETYPAVDVDAGVSRSGEIRFNVEWPRALNALKKNPLVGTGLGSITLATDNDYLRALGESGLLGFITFAAIIGYFFVITLPLIFSKHQTTAEKYSLIFLTATIAMLANAIFIDTFEASKTAFLFWIMMGIYYQNLELCSKKH